MSMDLKNLNIEDVAGLITKGIGNSLEEVLFQNFKAQAEVAARKAAKEIAERVSTHVTAIQRHDMLETRIDLHFNMISPEATPTGEIVGMRNGAPLVAWKIGSHQDLSGKKIFVA